MGPLLTPKIGNLQSPGPFGNDPLILWYLDPEPPKLDSPFSDDEHPWDVDTPRTREDSKVSGPILTIQDVRYIGDEKPHLGFRWEYIRPSQENLVGRQVVFVRHYARFFKVRHVC